MKTINFFNNTKYIFEFNSDFQKAFNYFCELFKFNSECEVSVIIVDSLEMQNLYKQYKNIDKTTDVLSFPSDYKELYKYLKYFSFGDIYLNYEQIINQSIEYNHTEKREWCYLFIHALLHIYGLDHMNKNDEKRMNDYARLIIDKIGVKK